MSDSGDDEFPDLGIEAVQNAKPYVVTRVDVDAEIKASLTRKELKAQIDQYAENTSDEKEASIEDYSKNIQPFLKPTICSFPPNRQFFRTERSLRCFNEGSLIIEQVEPSKYNSCNSDNANQFFLFLTLKLKQVNADEKCHYLKYLWLLLSSHSDSHVVQECSNLLLDYNASWRLTYDEVILVFYNWGVSPSDFVTDLPVQEFTAPLPSSPVVSPYNVENVLKVLINQLSRGTLTGYKNSDKTVFLLLILLSLDKDYQQCLAELHDCLELISKQAESVNPNWVKEFCDGLIKLELHHAQTAFLLQCVVPESMRWCLCLGHCEQVFKEQLSLQTHPNPAVLLNLLDRHFEEFLKLPSWDLYSMISIVDSGISVSVTFETDSVIKKGFLDWLNTYMDRKPERRSNGLDVDAVHIEELVSRLQAEWELLWLEGHNSQSETVEEIDGVMDVDEN